MISETIKALQLVGQAALSPSLRLWTPAGYLAISLKDVPEGNRRFWKQNQLPSSWGGSPALLGQVGLASTNTGCFRVSCSRCGPRPARLRKTCYHSCYTDSVQESKRFWCFKNFGPLRALFFFIWNYEIGEKLLLTQAAPNSSVIGLWVEIWYRNKTTYSESNPVQSSRSKSTTCPRKGLQLRFELNAQWFQMEARKSLETMSGMILDR